MEDVRVDRYIEDAAEFARPVLRQVRALVHRACGEVDETIKWSRPFFVYRGEIVANMAAFKAHCSFGLWGPGMSEVLRAEGVAGDDASGSIGRLTCVADLPEEALLLGWLTQAFQMAADRAASGQPAVPRAKGVGRNMPEVAKGELAVPGDLSTALAAVSGAVAQFNALSRSCRKEYVQWIEGAKRAETRTKRVAEAVGMIAQGKRRNWKYEASAGASLPKR